MATEGIEARRLALQMLAEVIVSRRMLSDLPIDAAKDPADRARALRLAQTVLRHLSRADAVLEPHLTKAPPLRVRNAMRLAVVELAELQAPAHAAVNAAVELTRRQARSKPLAGMVNAVLRKALEGLDDRWSELPVQQLPKWLRASLVKSWGDDVVAAIETVHMTTPPVDLTPGPGMTEDIREQLPVTELPTGSLRLKGRHQISALPGFEEGAFWVQDAAAAIPARVLAAKSGERVLDLCAAPGGKTLQLAATGAEVTALDISAERLSRVAENMTRTGLSANLITADAMTWTPPFEFDAILIDAPCSATGTLRRHPDLPLVKNGDGIKDLAKLQREMLARASQWLKPGGRLVFATCSLLPMEGELHMHQAKELGLSPELASFDLPGIQQEWKSQGGLRLRPDLWADIGGMDGFFISSFTKD